MTFLSRGEKLRTLRKKLHIEPKDLEQAGISRSFISMVETGKRKINKDTAKKIAELVNNKAKKLGVDCNIDEDYLLTTQRDDAKKYCSNMLCNALTMDDIEELMSIANKYKLEEIIPRLYLKKADILYSKKNFSDAFTLYYNALERLIKLDDMFMRPYIYNQLGKCRGAKLDIQEALSFFGKAYEYASALNHKSLQCHSLYNLAKDYNRLKDYDKSLMYIEKLFDLCDENSNFTDYIKGSILRGNCYINKGQYKEAINQYNSVLNLFFDTSDPLIGFIYNNLGQAYLKLNNISSAQKFFNKSKSFRELYDNANLYRTIIDLSMLYIKIKDYTKALDLLNTGLYMATENKDDEYTLNAYNQLEKVYTLLNNAEKLEEIYIKMLDLLDVKSNHLEILKIHIKLSLLNFDKGRSDLGKDYLVNAIL